MRVISNRTLREFWEKHTDVEDQLLEWYKVAKNANWQSFDEITDYFGHTCKIVGSDRVIFKIKGNKYRLIIMVNFEFQTIYICFIGTHAEYDKIDAKTI